MMGTTHALTASAAWLAAAPHLFPSASPAELAVGAVITAGFAVVPDLDHPDATAARRLGRAGRVMARLVSTVSGGHRQGTHSLLAVAVVCVLVWFLAIHTATAIPLAAVVTFGVFLGSGLLVRVVGGWASAGVTVLMGVAAGYAVYLEFLSPAVSAVAVALGYAAHLAGDAITTHGIALLWPFTGARFGVPLMRTDSKTEAVTRLGFLILTGWLAWRVFGSPSVEGPLVLVEN